VSGVAIQDEATGHSDGFALEIDVLKESSRRHKDRITVDCNIYGSLDGGVFGRHIDHLRTNHSCAEHCKNEYADSFHDEWFGFTINLPRHNADVYHTGCRLCHI